MTLQDLHSKFLLCDGIVTDSRVKKEGAMFFALKGDNFNGNKFAQTSLNNGCRFAVVDEAACCVDDRYILVENVLSTLQQLANFHRRQSKARVIGITGTNGKTTTKELVYAVLSCSYETICTRGNLNNHIGVPLTLLEISEGTEYAVIEMGANHPGEIRDLCLIAEPDFGLITSIGIAHLEGFGSFENIVRTKKELYDFVSSRGGMLFVNGRDALFVEISSGTSRELYGNSGSIVGKLVNANPYVQVAYFDDIKEYLISTRLIGSYNLDNILAAVCIGKFFGVSNEDIVASISSYIPENNRSQMKNTGSNVLVLDAYNANPSSMEAALVNFEMLEARSKVVILGEMLELGEESKKEHERIYKQVCEMNLDERILVGRWDVSCGSVATRCFNSAAELIDYLGKEKVSGKLILIKGSRGNKLETIVNYL